jgi:epoxyqueuosine reductase
MIAVGNSGDSGLIPFVKKALNDEEPIVRAHAAWALWRLQGSDSQDTLSKHLDSEIDPMVREEIVSILNTTA